ncbi:MAG: 3-deoxy-D-manno-octulosonic acid transferase, partial [Candidatus Kapaibacterium sp.]
CAYAVLILMNPKVRRRFRATRSSHAVLFRTPSDATPPVRTVWFHAASMGEFEQAKPVIERLKETVSDVRVVVSFSSPSGYESQQSYPFADAVIYLPFDALWSMRALVRKVAADVFVCLRYDLWWNLAWSLKRTGTPILLLNATTTRSLLLRTFPGRGFYRHLLGMCSTIVTADAAEAARLTACNIDTDIVVGSDTRYDRIRAAVDERRPYESWFVRSHDEGSMVMVAGSVWNEDRIGGGIDDDLCSRHPGLRLIIVPHEIDEASLRTWEQAISGIVRLTAARASGAGSAPRHVLVDTMGELLALYRHADIAFVGGGFGSGVHSVAEAAAYGIPVACGPRTRGSADVERLRSVHGCREIGRPHDLDDWIRTMSDTLHRHAVGTANRSVIEAASGATASAVERISSLLR